MNKIFVVVGPSGHPYHFLSHAEFKKRMAQDYFVEWAQVHDQLYGTPKDQIKQAWRDGHAVIMDIDVQGAKTFMSKYPQETITIFILPPSIDALRQRVIKREGRKPEDLELRMTRAKEEMAQANEFDFQLVNDDFVQAFSEFKKIIEKAVG